MNPSPTKLERTPDHGLAITWTDGQRRAYAVRQLRDACPCASCREKRSQPPEPKGMLTVLSLNETQPLSITKMEPVGNYAYSIEFSDGHGTGIYTLDLLRQLGAESN